MTKELLQREFDSLTAELKEMDSSDRSYLRVWNERAEISRQLFKKLSSEFYFSANQDDEDDREEKL